MKSVAHSPGGFAPAATSPNRLTVQPPRPTGPEVRGKFLYLGGEKFYVRGVTYGPFRPDAQAGEYGEARVVDRDFARMSEHGFNAVRTYTPPPRWLLDCAATHGLYVMVGLPWEQHVAFLSDARTGRSIEKQLRESVRASADHPAILCYAIGNEIPAPIVRWHGHRAIERYLRRLYEAAKDEAPEHLVTYVNYPSTEYLHLPFLDLACFNVYLESQKTLEAYLARLQNLAGERPLLMAEIGLDSRRNGEERQARALDWQIRTTLAAGAAGTFVFAWTDEWFRGGHDILDWDFGITTRTRQPKRAFSAVTEAFADGPFGQVEQWPRASVVVCTYNGSRTLAECLRGLAKLNYPAFDVIVVDDGSKDNCSEIARQFDCRLIRTENRGLSHARNVGLEAATGEIVAYIDDDACPDPDWLRWLVSTLQKGGFAGVGGPNIAPPGDGPIAEAVWNSPGGPNHVLLSDRVAEHIPGCNMAFRRACLRTIGGFDPQFRAAGDDVDICWRLQDAGWHLGFSGPALVWHHRRNSIRAYWKQQRGYGKAEALLEKKWPEKYNSIGHIKWSGRIYGLGLTRCLGLASRIYHGPWGTALFQSRHAATPGWISILPTMPEWYLILAGLFGLGALGLIWSPLLWVLALVPVGVTISVLQALLSARQGNFPSTGRSRQKKLFAVALTTLLHLLQPAARLSGRLQHGLTVWRPLAPHQGGGGPWPAQRSFWIEEWRSPEEVLSATEHILRREASLVRGGPYDRWDLEVRGGLLGATRLLMTVEEHGNGKQLFRFQLRPHFAREAVLGSLVLAILAGTAAWDTTWSVAALLSSATLLILVRSMEACSSAQAAIDDALKVVFRKV